MGHDLFHAKAWVLAVLCAALAACSSTPSSENVDGGTDTITDTTTDTDSETGSDTEPVCDWDMMALPEGVYGLQTVWGTSPTDVYAGSEGQIVHYDGTEWKTVLDTGGAIDLWGTSSSNVYAAWAGNGVLHYDGTSWSKTAIVGISDVRSIWGFGPNDIFAAGWDNSLAHFDGTAWTTISFPEGTPSGYNEDPTDFYAIWGSSPDDIHAVGGGPTQPVPAAHWDGSAWTPVAANGWDRDPMIAILGFSSGDVFAIVDSLYSLTSERCVVRYSGTEWVPFSDCINVSPYFTELVDLWGLSPTNMYAIGNYTDVWHFDGSNWAALVNLADKFVPDETGVVGAYAIWGTSDKDIFVVGSYIWHYWCKDHDPGI
jgi:hypothetical protein